MEEEYNPFTWRNENYYLIKWNNIESVEDIFWSEFKEKIGYMEVCNE